MNCLDVSNIANSNKKFIFATDDAIYPSYKTSNGQYKTYVDFLYNINNNYEKIIFKNGDVCDLRRENVQIITINYTTG